MSPRGASVSERGDREALLRQLGAADGELPEILAYLDTPYRGFAIPNEGLPAEPQLGAWLEVANGSRGALLERLSSRFPQLLFPVEAGMSQTEAYRAATRRGEFRRHGQALGLALEKPDGVELRLEDLPAGTTPVLIAATRSDFVKLVQAFACRNEPEEIPDSMGACLVRGLADWGRLDGFRKELSKRLGREPTAEEWGQELALLANEKERWQARLILLSRGPYSAVPARELGLDAKEWEARSLELRLAHEGLHYLTLRLWGRVRSNLLDELVADAVGMVRAFGSYSAPLALRFLGVASDGTLLPGARLAIYRGEASLSDQALTVVARMAVLAAGVLERLLAQVDWSRFPPSAQARLWVAILGKDLLEWINGSLDQEFEATRFQAQRGDR